MANEREHEQEHGQAARRGHQVRAEGHAEAPERELTEQERAHEAHERGRAEDKDKPLTERRPEFLTADERVAQAEQADKDFPSSWSPTQNQPG